MKGIRRVVSSREYISLPFDRELKFPTACSILGGVQSVRLAGERSMVVMPDNSIVEVSTRSLPEPDNMTAFSIATALEGRT